jgi:hypothetical protein
MPKLFVVSLADRLKFICYAYFKDNFLKEHFSEFQFMIFLGKFRHEFELFLHFLFFEHFLLINVPVSFEVVVVGGYFQGFLRVHHKYGFFIEPLKDQSLDEV